MNAVAMFKRQYQRWAGPDRRARPAGLDTSHDTILYLEDITVSFDGFQRAECADAVHQRG